MDALKVIINNSFKESLKKKNFNILIVFFYFL